jgi:hypothetical protein
MDLLQNTIKDPSFNSVNHRCKEVTDVLGPNLDFRKYFLVLGDNAGLHMHKPIEETWPHLVSKEISYSYYNACIIDGGLEAVRYNLITWLKKYSHNLPKMIYVSCEWANRFYGVEYDEEIKKASNLGDVAGYFLCRQNLFIILVEQINIPIYLIMRSDDVPMLISSNVRNIIVDHTDDIAVTKSIVEGFSGARRAISI